MTVQDHVAAMQREHLRGMRFVEDVLVFVMRRAVTDDDAVVGERSERKVLEEIAIGRAEMIARPQRRLLRDVVESDAFVDSGSDAIVITADVQLARAHRAHHIEHLIRLRAVPDEVAEADDAIVLFAAHALHNGAQCVGVGVKIADDERSHARLHAARLADSRKPFGNSRMSRSTISPGVSSSRISMVTSAVR